MNYTREQLIEICQQAVVPFKKWNNRDSYSAQVNINSIYQGLTGNVPYTYNIEDNIIWVTFEIPTEEQKKKFQYLNIDSREDYFEWYKQENGDDYTPEMFDGHGIDWSSPYSHGGYIPTTERLKIADGEDWY